MAPFRRSNASSIPEGTAVAASSELGKLSMDEFGDDSVTDETTQNGRLADLWDRRRRRIVRKKTAAAEQAAPTKNADSKRMDKEKKFPPLLDDEEYDPYDSDPGESYRQHCMKINGLNTKACLRMPRILARTNRTIEDESVVTAPPSPFHSDLEDTLNQFPVSLAPNATRVRYSLRTSIGDGSERQPTGPSVMERRELRPNGVQLNVSHWSDTGGRNYMEDR